MRIAQVAPLYESVPPKLYGGTERVVSSLIEELVRRGHDVTLFASGDSITKARLVPVCRQALRLDPRSVDYVSHHIRMLEQVFAAKDDFDLIHFHIDYLHFPMSRRTGVKQLTTLHGRLDLADLVPMYEEFRDMPVVSISDAQREPLPSANWLGTVYHGLPGDSLVFSPQGGEYLAFLGRISPEKGLDQAIEIAKRAKMPLKIAAKIDNSDGKYFERDIKPLLKHPLIEYVGEIGYSEKDQFLGNAAALLFPINWPEPFGLVMIEAMACGTPVIAYPYGSVLEIMEDGVTGFVVSDVDSAVDALGNLAHFNRRKCRQHFDEHFTAARMADDYLNIYERLVRGGATSISLPDGDFSWMKLALPSSTT